MNIEKSLIVVVFSLADVFEGQWRVARSQGEQYASPGALPFHVTPCQVLQAADSQLAKLEPNSLLGSMPKKCGRTLDTTIVALFLSQISLSSYMTFFSHSGTCAYTYVYM